MTSPSDEASCRACISPMHSVCVCCTHRHITRDSSRSHTAPVYTQLRSIHVVIQLPDMHQYPQHTGHAESLHIEMRDPALSFTSREEKTKKGSPAPAGRSEVSQQCRRQSVVDVCTHVCIYTHLTHTMLLSVVVVWMGHRSTSISTLHINGVCISMTAM